MVERDVRRARVLGGFVRHHTSAVIVLLHVNGVGTVQYQPQAAAFGDLPGKKRKAFEDVAVDFPRLYQLLLPN